MKPKFIYFSEWIPSRIAYAKSRDIKLTPKNIEKLRDVYTGWIYDNFGMNGLFKATYGENIAKLVPWGPNPLLAMMPKDEFKGSIRNPVVINGIHGVEIKKN